MEQRAHDPAIQAREPIFPFAVRVCRARLQNPHRGPRRHDERHHQGKDHGGTRANGNRPHVRSHQPSHKRHRQNRRDHRQRGQNGGIAYFVHRLHRHVERRALAIERHAPMAHDVFQHHDGVIHQKTDREDQREQRDAVQRVAIEIEDRQRQRQRHGNGDKYDERFAQPQRDGDQHAHRNYRDQHVPQQFVGFLGRSLAVIPGNGYSNVPRNHAALQRLNPPQHVIRDHHCVGSFAFRNRDGHRRIEPSARGIPHVLAGFFAAIADIGHVAHEDGFAVRHARHHAAHILRAAQELAGFE